jgi:hypothetical protein
VGKDGFPEPGCLTWKDRKEMGRHKFSFDNSSKMEHRAALYGINTNIYLRPPRKITALIRSRGLKCTIAFAPFGSDDENPLAFCIKDLHSRLFPLVCTTAQEVLERAANGAHWQIV